MQIVQKLFLFYIRFLAKIQLLKNKATIVGVTGSEGKSSVKKALELVLSTKYTLKYSHKANSETGIPLEILGIEVSSYSLINWIKVSLIAIWKLLTNWEKYDYYVVEMGIDSLHEPKNMSYLLKIVQPHIAIITSISAVHGAFYVDEGESKRLTKLELEQLVLERIASEKSKIITKNSNLKFGSLNIDNDRLRAIYEHYKEKLYSVSNSQELNPNILINQISTSRAGFNVQYQIDNTDYNLMIPNMILGEEYAYTFALAIAVGIYSEVPVEDSLNALKGYRSEPGRFNLFNGKKGSTIIDSTYNATPNSMKYAIKQLDDFGTQEKRKRVAILGDMRELGEIAQINHEEVAKYSYGKVDAYHLVGENMSSYFAPMLISLGVAKESISTYSNYSQLNKKIVDQVDGNSVILCKGSQNTIFLEEVVKELLENKDDISKLCRQNDWWMKRKEAWLKSASNEI